MNFYFKFLFSLKKTNKSALSAPQGSGRNTFSNILNIQNGIRRVTAEVDKDNIASVRVLEKSGFEPTGEIVEEGPIFCKPKFKESF
ncbi:MAG: GNAT family N-acetyltransferase [Clostridia bacterium]|nr:GNAT family N-acetyltransferase [Clostridia bacterium]